jgi:general secretion pathway protein J
MSAVPKEMQRTADDGFTIVEALIAITVFSLLSLLVTGALRFGAKAWQRGKVAAMEIDETAQVQVLLRRMIGNAQPRFVAPLGGQGYVDFDGQTQSVRFISDPPRSLDGGGRLMITLSADSAPAGRSFVMAIRPELGESDNASAVAERVLLSGVDNVAFSYFGAKQAGIEAQWHSTWTKQYALPDLMRIDISFAPGRAGLWPKIVVAPRIDVDVSCIYDTLTRGCRGR